MSNINSVLIAGRQRRAKQYCLFYLLTFGVIAFFVLLNGQVNADENEFITYFEKALKTLYSTLLKVSIAVAIVCVASAGLTMLLGGDKGAERAKRILMYTFGGLLIIWLAGLIIIAAKVPFARLGYNNGQMSGIFAAVPHLAEKIDKFYSYANKIVPALAVVSIAYGGACFFGMDILSQKNLEQQIEKGKTVIKITVIALAVFFLLPTVIKIGYVMFHEHGWDPANIPSNTEPFIY